MGDPQNLPSIDQATDMMAQDMGQMLGRLYNEQASQAQASKERFEREKARIVTEQRAAREHLASEQQQRQLQEQDERQERFRRGVLGLWDRVTGQHKRIAEQNRQETLAAQQRDQSTRDRTIIEQLEQRRTLQMEARTRHNEAKRQSEELQADKERFLAMRMAEAQAVKPERTQAPQQPQPPPAKEAEDRAERKRRYMEERKHETQSRNRDRGGPSLDR